MRDVIPEAGSGHAVSLIGYDAWYGKYLRFSLMNIYVRMKPEK